MVWSMICRAWHVCTYKCIYSMNNSSNFRTFNIRCPKVFLSNFFSLMITTNPYHGFPKGESPGIFQLVHSIARTASPLFFFNIQNLVPSNSKSWKAETRDIKRAASFFSKSWWIPWLLEPQKDNKPNEHRIFSFKGRSEQAMYRNRNSTNPLAGV